MKLLRSIVGTIAVLFSIQPLMGWAAGTVSAPSLGGGQTTIGTQPTVIQTDGKTPIQIQTDGEHTVIVKPDGNGRVLIWSPEEPGNYQINGSGTPQCLGGG